MGMGGGRCGVSGLFPPSPPPQASWCPELQVYLSTRGWGVRAGQRRAAGSARRPEGKGGGALGAAGGGGLIHFSLDRWFVFLIGQRCQAHTSLP